MSKIISQIKEELTKQGVSETKLASIVGASQKSVNNLLAGRTKRLDMALIEKLQGALGIVSEPDSGYTVAAVHRKITPEEEQLLQILESEPDIRDAVKALIELPPRKRKIHLGKMFEDLEKLEEGKD